MSATTSDPRQYVAELGLTFHWEEVLATVMPSPARCSFIPIFDRRQTAGTYFQLITGVGGGQESYSGSRHVRRASETLSDLWFALWPGTYYNQSVPSGQGPWLSERSLFLSPLVGL